MELKPGQFVVMDNMIKADAVLADKAYDRVRKSLREKGGTVVIPCRKNWLAPTDYDKELYKDRRLIENFFAKLKQYRAIATRYDKTSKHFLGAIHLASIVIWLH